MTPRQIEFIGNTIWDDEALRLETAVWQEDEAETEALCRYIADWINRDRKKRGISSLVDNNNERFRALVTYFAKTYHPDKHLLLVLHVHTRVSLELGEQEENKQASDES